MRTRRARSGARLVAVLMALVLVVAACGDDDAETTVTTSGATTEATTATTEAVTTTAAPVEKPQMVMALSDTVNIAEPHTFRSTSAYAVTHAVYEPLIRQEMIEQPGGWFDGSRENHVGAGAASYTIELTDAGGMLATFNLREDAKFDNGDPVTAEDYKYVFQRSIEGPGYIGVLLPFIGVSSADQLTVVDEYTFQIETTVQTPQFERFLTFQVFGALDKDLLDSMATDDDPWAFAYLNDKSTLPERQEYGFRPVLHLRLQPGHPGGAGAESVLLGCGERAQLWCCAQDGPRCHPARPVGAHR